MNARAVSLAEPMIGQEERDAVDRVLRAGLETPGAEVAAFEEEFSALVVDGCRCVAVNSGTSALLLSLLASGIGPGDEVILPSFTFAATANAVLLAGATPVFADIDPSHYCMSPAAVEAAISADTAAILPVHLYGHPADMTALRGIAEANGLAVIEDAAQAQGATWQQAAVGSLGLASAFSFYRTKNMTTLEGGMVVTRDPAVARQARLLRNQGMERQYANEIAGFNMRMTDMSAAIGRVQLEKLSGWNEQRRRHAEELDSALRDHVITPTTAAGAVHVYHQYTIRVRDRDDVRRTLRGAGVATGVYYPTPVHRLPACSSRAQLPETDRAAAEVLSLPVHPGLSREDLCHVADSVLEAVSR